MYINETDAKGLGRGRLPNQVEVLIHGVLLGALQSLTIKVVMQHTNDVQSHAVYIICRAKTSPAPRWSQYSLPVAYRLGLRQWAPLK